MSATRNSLPVRIKQRLGPILNVPQVNALRGVPMPDVTGDTAQQAIARMIVEGGRLIARVGETEGRAVAWRITQRLGRVAGATHEARNRMRLKLHSGVFPTDDAGIERFADRYLEAIARIDLYASWTPHDRVLAPRNVLKCRLIDIDPFFTEVKWSLALAGRRVTVVAPFKRTIEAQWLKRERLFRAPTLPDCRLTVVQAPQSHGDSDVAAQDWFGNLQGLIDAIDATDPEVLIIGAGAYALPAGEMATRAGASTVVMGGTTQLLFGIMGNRWENNPAYRALVTEAWTRPGVEERPPGFDKIETAGGAYW